MQRSNGSRISDLASYASSRDDEDDPRHGHEPDPAPYILEFLIYNDQTDMLATMALPAISIIGFFLNLVSLLAFSRASLKSNFYRHVFMSTVFDLIVTGLVVFKPLVKHILTEYIILMFVYVYLMSVALTCSTAARLAFTLDRLTKSLNNRFKLVFKMSAWRIILGYCALSVTFNSPLLIEYKYFDMTWFKQTYYEQTLNGFGVTSGLAVAAMVNAMAMNLVSLVLITVLSVMLRRAARENQRKLAQIMEIQKKRPPVDAVDITLQMTGDDCVDADEEGVDDAVDVENMPSLCHRGKFRSLENSDDPEFGFVEEEQCTSIEKRKKVKGVSNDPVAIEKERRKMANMVVVINGLFIVGHSLLLVCTLYEQVCNLLYGVAYKKNYEDYGMANVIANMILYTTMSSSFFAYVYFVRRFRQVIVGAFVCTVCSVCCQLEQLKKRGKKHLKK